jgi:hypothetical protein
VLAAAYAVCSCTIETDACNPSQQTGTGEGTESNPGTGTTGAEGTANDTGTTGSAGASSSSDTENDRKWTIVVYMAADNNLENAAISDLNEMEGAEYDHDLISVLALLDRSASYDSTNGDWSDTRLFEVTHDEGGVNAQIISKRLKCPELGLSAESETELDMGSKTVVSGLVSYARRMYPAQNISLIMWGHGTGWRSNDDSMDTAVFSERAFAIDKTDSSYLSIADLASGITTGMEDIKLAVCGFDTCFGATFETAYELRKCAELLVGTPGIESAGGWDYTLLFNLFSQTKLSAQDLSDSIVSQYKNVYSGFPYSCISHVELSRMESLFTSFDHFAKIAADCIDNKTKKFAVKEALENTSSAYYSASYPTDYYIDIKKSIDLLVTIFPSLKEEACQVNSDLALAVPNSWSASESEDFPRCLGVFYCQYLAPSITAPYHPAAYVGNSRVAGQTQFVINSKGYVPTQKSEGSFLDKVFYTQFE